MVNSRYWGGVIPLFIPHLIPRSIPLPCGAPMMAIAGREEGACCSVRNSGSARARGLPRAGSLTSEFVSHARRCAGVRSADRRVGPELRRLFSSGKGILFGLEAARMLRNARAARGEKASFLRRACILKLSLYEARLVSGDVRAHPVQDCGRLKRLNRPA